MEIDHIGYLVSDIDASRKAFLDLGYKQITEVISDDLEHGASTARNVYLCFMEIQGVRVELVSPINESSDVYLTLKRQGEGAYHICYRVCDLSKSIAELKTQGYVIVKKPETAIAFHNAKVAFMFKKYVGLIELLEKRNL